MIISKYSQSTHKKSTIDVINAGTSDDNIKVIQLDKVYKNPKFYPKKFKNWPDTFNVTYQKDSLIIKRTDVEVGGWGEQLLIEVEFEEEKLTEYKIKNQKIPKVIFQTFETCDLPEGMYFAVKSWIDKNPDYEHYFFDENDRLEFIEKHFDKNVLETYLKLIPGAFKADLWRCCVLYIKGGIYVDSDMICLESLNSIIEENDEFIISRDDPMSKAFLANGFIASVPRHEILYRQIYSIVDNVKNLRNIYYLDISGPSLFGKSVNIVCKRKEDEEFELGTQKLGDYTLKIFQHDFISKSIKDKDRSILITEYPEKTAELKKLNYDTFYEMYQQGRVYQTIPFDIYFTTFDNLGVNTYMYDSFFSKNKNWNLHHYTDDQCKVFLEKNNNILKQELGVDVLNFYKKLENGGEKSDIWRYCIIYLNGGVYTDADTYCNVEVSKWVSYYDLIFGIEAYLPLEDAKTFGMEKIGIIQKDYVMSVCNWTFAAKPRHSFFKKLIIDIIQNPIQGNVLLNTGPGRLTRHVVDYFENLNYSLLKDSDIIKDNSVLFNINRFGSNQSHSNSIKNWNNELDIKNDNVFVIHKFEGTWRNIPNNKIKKIKSNLGVSHNITVKPTKEGYVGISRLDKDTSRTVFMESIGDCRSLLEVGFDKNFNVLYEKEKPILGYNEECKFEDFRYFKFNQKDYYSVSYVDKDFNTKIAILDGGYNFLGNVQIEQYNEVSWLGKLKIWEKNWLFFEKNNELYFIYSTTPNYIVYKCLDFETLHFIKHIDIEWPLDVNVPSNEHYFTASIGSKVKIATGGSTSPIYLEKYNLYLYLIHTKFYSERKYNHYAVLLNADLMPIKLVQEPLISKYVQESLLFISSNVLTENYLVLSGGVEDRYNFIWELSLNNVYKLLGL